MQAEPAWLWNYVREELDCWTRHNLKVNSEDSRVKIPDGESVQFIREAHASITLIVMDHYLDEHCKFGKLPRVRLQYVVADYMLRKG